MASSIKTIPSRIFDYIKNMEKGKRRRLIILVSLIIIVLIIISVFLNQKTYTVLYSGMDRADTAEVLSLLGEMGVDAKADGEDTVLVEGNDVDTIRLELASRGYPSSGLNYDIYKNASGLGVTDAEKKVYYQYQLQENLRRTIMQMKKVEDAVVNIDLGEESSYVLSDDNKEATASIMLSLANGATLGSNDVNAIAELVSKGVSGLELDNIRIVDSQSKLYTVGSEDDAENTDSQMALQSSVQTQLSEQIMNLLSPVFGEENVLTQVSVKLNFDKTVSESIEYSIPEGRTEGLVVSMKELVEAITNDSEGAAAGIDSNGNSSEYLASLDENEDAVYYNISREVNYEINQTTTQIEQAKGEIEYLSVSVILNSRNTDDYIDEVKQLIATAVGADTDSITVEMLPFADLDVNTANEMTSSLTVQQQMLSSVQSQETTRLIILVIGALIVVIFIFAIIKTLRPQTAVSDPQGFEMVADEQIVPDSESEEEYKGISINSLEEKDDNLSVLKEYVDKNPESVANLLRNWLNEE